MLIVAFSLSDIQVSTSAARSSGSMGEPAGSTVRTASLISRICSFVYFGLSKEMGGPQSGDTAMPQGMPSTV